jgi:hypothetical protein
MSDTPRTDEEEWSAENYRYSEFYPDGDKVVDASFARQLERELAEAKTDSLRLDWLTARQDVRIIEKDESLGTWTASEILESRKSIDEAMERADK